MEIVLLNTPPDYGQQIWVDNIKYMLDNNNREYDTIHVVDDVVYGGVYDKLLLFDRFREGQYLYFDLDIVINSSIVDLYTTKFTLLMAWWRDAFHTPLNSSIMSWCGDYSHIYNKFAEDPDYYMIKYRGLDRYLSYNHLSICKYLKFDYDYYFRWKNDATPYKYVKNHLAHDPRKTLCLICQDNLICIKD